MKKTVAVLLMILLALVPGASAVFGAEEGDFYAESTETSVSMTDPEAAHTEDGQVLFETENCRMTVTGYDPEDPRGFVADVFCENMSHKFLLFSVMNAAVNGCMLSPDWSIEIGPGKNADSEIVFERSLLDRLGADVIEDILLDLYVNNANNWMDDPLYEGKVEVYPTGMAPEEIVYPERLTTPEEQVIADNGSFAFILLEADADAPEGYTLRICIDNRTEQDLMFSWDNVSVNDCLVDPYWAAEVMAGKRCYADIVFPIPDSEKNGIGIVEGIGLTMTVYDRDNVSASTLYNETFTIYP